MIELELSVCTHVAECERKNSKRQDWKPADREELGEHFGEVGPLYKGRKETQAGMCYN